jgi:hypothetical protein
VFHRQPLLHGNDTAVKLSATLLDWLSQADIRNFGISLDGRVESKTTCSHRVSPP